jgi:hypothetical protein
MKRDLITEVSTSPSPDVMTEIDAEATHSEIDRHLLSDPHGPLNRP